jgi:hypothetical protein
MNAATLERWYRRLLAWFPAEHRRVYGEEMVGVLLASHLKAGRGLVWLRSSILPSVACALGFAHGSGQGTLTRFGVTPWQPSASLPRP